LGFWIVVQVLNGLLTFNHEGGGVAWFAHIGGFAAGMLLVGLFKRRSVPWGWRRYGRV
jgi:membrane associated rhomboid family serine protease